MGVGQRKSFEENWLELGTEERTGKQITAQFQGTIAEDAHKLW